MLYSVNGSVDLIQDETTRCLCIIIPQNEALTVLKCIVGLETERIGAFHVVGENLTVSFRNAGQLEITVQSEEVTFTDKISDNHLMLMKCCIMDAALNTYKNPHEDFECSSCDISFGFGDSEL